MGFMRREPRSSSSAVESRFIIEVTMGAGESFTMPTITGYTYNYTVDWGDGSSIDTITAFDQAERIHDYTASGAGVYTIIMEGLCQTWHFKTVTTSALKLTKIVNLGSMGWTVLINAFQDCVNLTSCTGGDTSNITSLGLAYVFASDVSLVSVDTTGWDTSGCTGYALLFYRCTLLESIGVLDCTTITNMALIVALCPALSSGIFLNASVSFSLLNCNFDAAGLDAIYTALGDGTGQTITVTGNPGVGGDDPSIATAKNWTVVGS